MRFGRLVESFDFLPTINLGWYVWKGKRHFYLGASWLFWFVTTLDKFEWEETSNSKKAIKEYENTNI